MNEGAIAIKLIEPVFVKQLRAETRHETLEHRAANHERIEILAQQ